MVFISTKLKNSTVCSEPLVNVDSFFRLRIFVALGQVMLYVDGMNGVIQHNETIQWLYSLTASKVSKLLF